MYIPHLLQESILQGEVKTFVCRTGHKSIISVHLSKPVI